MNSASQHQDPAEQILKQQDSATKAAVADGSTSAGANSNNNNNSEKKTKKMPTAVFLIGMAGTGKTTLTQRINHFVVSSNIRSYFVNIDPAVQEVPFAASIDIRDTVTQKEVMAKLRLGPNGAIMTALNIFATRINEVLELIEKRADDLDFVFIDTPGQIEAFTWSASGQLITEAFSATMPTVMLFIADTVRCANPQTFMSTMMYSCSVMYKTQLPLCVVFNKCDVTDGSRATQWIEDSEAFSEALRQQRSFAATLADSLSLFMNEFYRNIAHVTVSALEGTGISELFEALESARDKFEREYAPMLQQRQKLKDTHDKERVRIDTMLLQRDVSADLAEKRKQEQQEQPLQEQLRKQQPRHKPVQDDDE